MKNYRFLEAGEYTQPEDEILLFGNWRKVYEGEVGMLIPDRSVNEYRRPVPFTGKVAFLVNYSPIIRVEIDTTGLSDEEIDSKISEEAKHKLWLNYKEHLDNFHENIDWENTKEDTECPAT